MRLKTALLVSVACAALTAATAITPVSAAGTADKKIALSNNYAGNSWRQAMLTSWAKVAGGAAKTGVVGAADAYTTAENQATEQAAQIQNLILQGYNAIVIDAASPTAINGAVKEACDAGIVVVSFDGIVTEPCAWRVAIDFKKMGEIQVDYLAKRYPDGGNLLEIRGLAGTSVDQQIHDGIHAGVAAHPNFKIVSEVQGDWTQTVAQKSVAGVLPSLPPVVAVVTQGGDGFGAAEAFKAANRPMPTIVMGNRDDELRWWQQQHKANGYETMSVSIAPGVSTLAFWVAQQILDGQDVPKDLSVPFLSITQDTLDGSLKTLEAGSVANIDYTIDDAKQVIAAAKAK